MSMLRQWRKLGFLLRRQRFERELAEEMQLHRELRGPDPRRFGNALHWREASRDVWTWRWLEDFAQDLRFAGRTLARKPAFAMMAAFTLALGIGAATAVFSIVDAVLLRPLPYRDSARLVAIWDRGLHEKGVEKIFEAYVDFDNWRRHARSFDQVAAATWAYGAPRTWTGRGPARQLMAEPVSWNFFDTLGVRAALGRTFMEEDERHGCAVVLAHGFWADKLASDASAVGQTLTLNQRACTVLGVMPPHFTFYPQAASMWILLGPDFEPKRENGAVGIFARLKPGVTRAQAQAEVAAMHRALHRQDAWSDFEPAVYDLHGEFTFLASRTLRATLVTAFGAVLFVLLIGCLNVANLLLARLADRQREFAVRAALGSGQGRLVRQVLTEGLLLSAIGTGGGIAFTFAAVRLFRATSPIELTVGADVAVNLPVLLFSGALAILTTVLFELLPALRSSRADFSLRLKTGGRGALGPSSRRRTAQILIAVEMALSFLLLIGAGLLLRSALRMGAEPLGFNPDRLLESTVALPAQRYSETKRAQFYQTLLERLEGVPGLTAVAFSSKIPPEAGGNQILEIRGVAPTPGLERHDVGADAVSSRFFDVVGIPLLRGRSFDSRDREHTQPVAVVNEALVREYFPSANPIGQQIRVRDLGSQQMPWLTVIGIVGNLKHTALMNEMTWVESPILYRPFLQEPRPTLRLALRAAGSLPKLGEQIARQISALDSSVPVGDVETVTSEISRTLSYARFRAVVLGSFALAALLLSMVGLHSVLSQLVAQRTAEFGLRRAIGAQAFDLLILVGRQGAMPVLIGLTAGVLATLAFGRVLAGLLYGIQPADPRILAGVAVLLLMVAAIAIALPARRAAQVDPMVALRAE